MKNQKSSPKKVKAPDKDMMESCNISPWYSVGKVLPTSTKPKEDVFDSYRPNRQCVDYTISETWTKMQRGDVKVNIRQTSATYEEIPPEICKPQRKKKLKLFSGGPPQWKFIDEIYREQMDERQKQLRKEHHKAVRQAQIQRTNKRKNDHDIVQRLIGPYWFMELSTQQFQAIDQLRKSVYLDLRKQTTVNCQAVLVSLGLIIKNSQKYISVALEHSCGCPEEFLLVLYQIINPNRQSYSLNDRLLLSAVVHLSITQTLRELHIRIPSPPRTAKKIKKKSKRKNNAEKIKYKSPYLEPLTYTPEPPKHSGIYKNKHRQYPESPYFSYLPCFELEKRFHGICFNYSLLRGNEEQRAKEKEYKDAQEFYETLPGVTRQMLQLLPATNQRICYNLFNPRKTTPIKAKRIAPHLCKVTTSEPVICYCAENKQKRNLEWKNVRRSCCEKNAQEFLESLCLCDDCLEKVAQKNLIRIHGGFLKSCCTCSDPVPIIQGTLVNRTCECYKEYRNKVVGCAARQFLATQKSKYVVGGIIMTKFGPVYNIHAALGEKICNCREITQRKMQISHIQTVLRNNEAKFAVGGITMSKIGPVYNLTAVITRKPCTCIVRYKEELKILEIQNEVRKNPHVYVNHGLINGNQGPVFYFSNVVSRPEVKNPLDLHEVCSCEIKKPKCFQRCIDYLEYKVSSHKCSTPSSEENSSSDKSEYQSEDTTTTTTEQRGQEVSACPYCAQKLTSGNNTPKTQRKCFQSQKSPLRQKSSTSETDSSTNTSGESESSSNQQESTSSSENVKSANKKSESEDFFATQPKACRCKEELGRFMKSKCPCEECNRKIRQGYATYVMGGTKSTSSGNQVNIVQGIQQHLCGCMREHLENVRKIDEYKSRVKARYDLKKQPKKYCISGVKNTPDGPVYIISGLRPPVDCECAKAIREETEKEEFEKHRAKMPNTGRIKYEISGVKAMPEENVYIMSRALLVSQCDCEKLLKKFEDAHKSCIEEFEHYLELIEHAVTDFNNNNECGDERQDTGLGIENIQVGATRSTLLEMDQIHFDPSFEIDKILPDRSIAAGSNEEQINMENKVLPEAEKKSDEPKESECACAHQLSESEEESSSDESSSNNESSSSSESDGSECGSCRVENPPEMKPVTMPTEKYLPESFLSKRFAIFRKFPRNKKTQMKILKHILEGMAEDGFPLAKLPQVYKLPIFKLWLELRAGVFWTYEDRLKYFDRSKTLWKHSFVCNHPPKAETMPFTKAQARKMTWNHAKLIRKLAANRMNSYYRKLKQATVETGREFFAPTFSYEFPTPNWRECAFAYLPTKETGLFPYRIVQPHDTRCIPDNMKTRCYC